MIANILVHLEHVDSGLLEYSEHFRVAKDLSLIGGILEVVGFDMLPETLDDLRARKLRDCAF